MLPRILQSKFLSLDRRNNGSLVLHGTEFEVPDALPGASIKLTILDRNSNRSADKRGFYMSL